MAVFEREIGGDEEFVAGWRGKDSAVVADAKAEVTGGRSCGAVPDGGYESEFSGGRHETKNTLPFPPGPKPHIPLGLECTGYSPYPSRHMHLRVAGR